MPISAGVLLQYSIVIFITLLEIAIIWAIFKGKIDLKLLISEKTGEASLSRFQLLVFTFAIAGLYVAIGFNGTSIAFPKVDETTLGLLGVSGLTYGGSKFIQKTSEKKESGETSDTQPSGRFARRT